MWVPFGKVAPRTRLVGPRILVRPPRRLDAAAWSALREASRDFLQPWEPSWTGDAASVPAFHRRRRQLLADWQARTGYGFLIFGREDGELLGGITLANVRRGVAGAGSLGYWIGEPHARRGYMTEAVSCLLDFAFGELGLNRVEAACLPDNAASRALLLKCGFVEEGVARQFLKINGRWQDHVTFAILRSDPRPGSAPDDSRDD